MDEVYFYLCCRDLLNGGPVLRNPSNCFEIVQREEVRTVVVIVRKILARFGDRDADSIILKMRENAIIKTNKKEYIDIGFVLKILLELYRADKRVRYDYL